MAVKGLLILLAASLLGFSCSGCATASDAGSRDASVGALVGVMCAMREVNNGASFLLTSRRNIDPINICIQREFEKVGWEYTQ